LLPSLLLLLLLSSLLLLLTSLLLLLLLLTSMLLLLLPDSCRCHARHAWPLHEGCSSSPISRLFQMRRRYPC
jgi:hypothetical protein